MSELPGTLSPFPLGLLSSSCPPFSNQGFPGLLRLLRCRLPLADRNYSLNLPCPAFPSYRLGLLRSFFPVFMSPPPLPLPPPVSQSVDFRSKTGAGALTEYGISPVETLLSPPGDLAPHPDFSRPSAPISFFPPAPTDHFPPLLRLLFLIFLWTLVGPLPTGLGMTSRMYAGRRKISFAPGARPCLHMQRAPTLFTHRNSTDKYASANPLPFVVELPLQAHRKNLIPATPPSGSFPRFFSFVRPLFSCA